MTDGNNRLLASLQVNRALEDFGETTNIGKLNQFQGQLRCVVLRATTPLMILHHLGLEHNITAGLHIRDAFKENFYKLLEAFKTKGVSASVKDLAKDCGIEPKDLQNYVRMYRGMTVPALEHLMKCLRSTVNNKPIRWKTAITGHTWGNLNAECQVSRFPSAFSAPLLADRSSPR